MLENTNGYDEDMKKLLTVCGFVVAFWVSCIFVGFYMGLLF